MNITAGLAADLRLLTAALDDPDADIARSLQRLAGCARTAVPTYAGLSVNMSRSDPQFGFTHLVDGVRADDIATSLRLTLTADGDGDGDGQDSPVMALTLYATSPGTFVDLAADLAWLTGRPLCDFVIDQHLAIPAGTRIGRQLAEASISNQAIGVLIGRGYTTERAHRQLDARAALAGIDRHAAAQLILSALRSGDVDLGFDVP